MDNLLDQLIGKMLDDLIKMDDVIDNSRSAIFSGKITIEKTEMYTIIDDMRGTLDDMRRNLPKELNSAKRLLSEKDNIRSLANEEAQKIIRSAENTRDKILDEHEITLQAEKEARELKEETLKDIEQWKLQARAYVADILHEMDDLLRKQATAHIEKTIEVEDFYKNLLAEIYDSSKKIDIDLNKEQ